MGHDILIVDDERDICTLIAGILEDEGHTARRAHNSTEAIDAVRQRRPALVILDVWLQGSELDGLQLLDAIRREERPIPVVMISGHGTIDTAVSAIKSGAYDFIEKPFKADRLLLVVERAVEADRLRRENETLRRRAGGDVGFVGSSSDAAAVRTQIERVAPTGSRVLITGASGAGKESVARLIHQGSKRADGPFVVVNCSTLPAERLEVPDLAPEARGFQRAVGDQHKAVGLERLLNEIVGAPLYCRDGGFDVAVAGNHHHRHFRVLLLDGIEQLQAVEPAALEPDVEEQKVGAARLDLVQGGIAVARGAGGVAFVLEQARDQLTDVGLVINNQNIGRHVL